MIGIKKGQKLMGKNIIKISPKMQLDIFEMVFLYMIEKPSLRWRLSALIDSRDNVDNAEVDLKLKKLELELIHKNGGTHD